MIPKLSFYRIVFYRIVNVLIAGMIAQVATVNPAQAQETQEPKQTAPGSSEGQADDTDEENKQKNSKNKQKNDATDNNDMPEGQDANQKNNSKSSGDHDTDTESPVEKALPGVEVQDQSSERPTPPGGAAIPQMKRDASDQPDNNPTPKVIEGAGMGGPIPYAQRGVIELGGRLTLDIRDEIQDFTIEPSIGYFIIDNLELSIFPFLNILRVEGETAVRIGGLFEPSYHIGLLDWLYAFVGLGVGVTYEDGPGFDGLLRPVVGTDIMVGRSGILKPGLFLDVGLGDGAIGGGFQAAFTVML